MPEAEQNRDTSGNSIGAPGLRPSVFAFDMPKPRSGFHQSNTWHANTDVPSWRAGRTHGFASQEGTSRLLRNQSVASALAVASGATPAQPSNHSTGFQSPNRKPEVSTLLGTGTFYFALTRGFSYQHQISRPLSCSVSVQRGMTEPLLIDCRCFASPTITRCNSGLAVASANHHPLKPGL